MKSPSSLMPHRADWLTLALLSLLTASFGWAWAAERFWLSFPCGILVVTACAAKHNHTHCPTFSSRALNRLLEYWLTILTGSSTTGIRVAHNVRHHGKNQSPEDFVRCSIVSRLPSGLALAAYVPRVVWEGWRHRESDLRLSNATSLRAKALGERGVLWLFIISLLVADAPKAMVVFGLPWLFGQWFLIAINLPQHDGCDPDSPHAHSRNVVGRRANWLFLNNGFHSAHHDRPGLHWSLLPSYHQKRVAPLLPTELSFPSLPRFWAHWWRQRNRTINGR